MGRLAFFPTPYPDEILYSVLCRYHIRSGNPGVNTTVKDLWGQKGVAKSLYLPTDLNRITDRMPDGTGITLEKLIWNHTMYPYVRLSLPKQRAKRLIAMLQGEEPQHRHSYQIAGLLGRKLPVPSYLRFCPCCVKDDATRYGEAYWHRLHQLPGVMVCPIHRERIRDSRFSVHTIFRYFYPADETLCLGMPNMPPWSEELADKHLHFARDCAWALEPGAQSVGMEGLMEKHLQFMQIRGYRGHAIQAAECDYRKLNRDIQVFYGEEFLTSLNAYDQDAYFSWPARFTRNSKSTPPMFQHLLLMRFWAGTPEAFSASTERYMPYGEPPWPCHNKLCDYYLQDCIETIEMTLKQGQHKAVFTCPHCGFSYRRGKALSKSRQYEGQVRIVDFGWQWRETLRECIVEQGLSVHQTVLKMGFPDTTIRKYAVQMGLLPERRMPKRPPRYSKSTDKALPIPEGAESHRNRWLQLVADNPESMRHELGRLDFENYKWMLYNDYEWFDTNTPDPVKRFVDWVRRDEEYLVRTQDAIAEMQGQSGRPVWLCYSSIANQAGIGNRIYHLRENLPKTKQFLDSVIEEKDEWRRRKIVWAIRQLLADGRKLSYNSVSHASGISSRVSREFREYIQAELKKQEHML